MVGTARSIEITKVSYHAWQLKSRVPMLPLVRCATISRQLGQGRQRSGGSPLFMINHRSSNNNNNNNMMMMMKNNRAVLDRLVLPPDEGEPNAAECFVHNY